MIAGSECLQIFQIGVDPCIFVKVEENQLKKKAKNPIEVLWRDRISGHSLHLLCQI